MNMPRLKQRLAIGLCLIGLVWLADATPSKAVARSKPTQHKFAYVVMHYEGTVHDDDYLLGLRVLIYSIKRSGSTHDIVCLLSNNVRQRTEDILKADGAKIIRLPNIENPYEKDSTRRKKYDPRFVFVMNKLYIWNLTDYKRVLYMDTDNLVFRNADSLFYCGKWCTVYFNRANFHTGLMVVEPDEKIYNQMIEDMKTLESYDGGDQGFLTQYATKYKLDYNLPIFFDERRQGAEAADTPLDDPFMVIPINLNLHALYVWKNLGWGPWAQGEYKDFDPPCMTYAMTSPSYLKPWYWYPHIVLPDSHQYWMWFRYDMEREEGFDRYDFWMTSLFLRVAMLTCAVSCALLFIRKKMESGGHRLPNVKYTKISPAATREGRGKAAFFWLLSVAVWAATVYMTVPMATSTFFAIPIMFYIHFVSGITYLGALSLCMGFRLPDALDVLKFVGVQEVFVFAFMIILHPALSPILYHTTFKILFACADLVAYVFNGVEFYQRVTVTSNKTPP